ncbi:MAG: AzlD domain-containing protein [Nitriliruptorales bacterium]|nr:AzlD domain-containing protein [Nitriliruptorales bacterium]
MSDSSIWLVIVLGGLGTYAIRAVFLVFAERVASVPPKLQVAFRMIPAAALAALVFPPLLRPEGALTVASAELGAGLLALVVAWRTRSIPITLAVGITAVLILDRLT